MKLLYTHKSSVISAFLLIQPNVLRLFVAAMVEGSSDPEHRGPSPSSVTAS